MDKRLVFSPCGNHCVFGPEAVNRAILHAQGNDSHAFPFLHQQVQGKILHKVAGVVPQRLSHKSTERTQGSSRAPERHARKNDPSIEGGVTHPTVERVQERVTRPVGHTAAPVGLASFTILQTLASERTLVDPPIICTAERHAKVLQLEAVGGEGGREGENDSVAAQQRSDITFSLALVSFNSI